MQIQSKSNKPWNSRQRTMFVLKEHQEDRAGSFALSVVIQGVLLLGLACLSFRAVIVKSQREQVVTLVSPYLLPKLVVPPAARVHVVPPPPRPAPVVNTDPAPFSAPPPPARAVMPAAAPMSAVPPVARPALAVAPAPAAVKLNNFTSATQASLQDHPGSKVQVGAFGFVETGHSAQRQSVQVGAFGDPSGLASGHGTHGSVSVGGFGQNRTDATTTAARPAVTAPLSTPVVVQSKARPAYTEEAARLHIEGEVLVDVVFRSDCSIQVLRVQKGLGHGLDQAAIEAVKKIRFSPAQREGHDIDSSATLHVLFQLS